MRSFFPTFLLDLRLSLRTLRKSPGFTLTAILTLAIGIGAVASVFSIVRSVLLEPFAFPHPERLVVIRERVQGMTWPDNYLHFQNWKSHSKTLADAGLFTGQDYSVAAGPDHPNIVPGLRITPSFFRTLGVQPLFGRGFVASDAVQHSNPVMILSWSAWQQYFRGNPSVIGRTLTVGGVPQTVIGVLPRGFDFPNIGKAGSIASKNVQPYQLFTPLDDSDNSITGGFNYLAIARVHAGVSFDQARAELNNLQADFAHDHHLSELPEIIVEPFQQEVTGSYSTALWVLFAAVIAILLIGCANLANLQLARAVSRERELAVRAALGAGTGRLLGTMLGESLVLAVGGGALGILFASAAIPLLIAAAPANVPRLDQAHMSWPVLLGATGLAALTTLLAGILPALSAFRVEPQSAMQTNPGRISGTREGRMTRNLLIGGEVACTVILLLITGLLLSSLAKLLTQGRDFNASHVTLAQASLYTPDYDDPDKSADMRSSFIDRALAGLRQIPGVQSAAVTSELPMGGDTWIDPILRPDQPVPVGHEPLGNVRWISPDYLQTLQIPLISGRALLESDRDHPNNAIISRRTAQAVWPGLDPVGRTFSIGGDKKYVVVGVAADARINTLHTTASMIYLPYWENPRYRAYFLIRGRDSTAVLAPSIRRALWSVDGQVPIPVLKSLDEQVDDSVATERFGTALLTTFGIAALLLAFLGIYGVTAYTVSMRTQEFGLRMALGSSRIALIRLVVRQAIVPVIGGLIVGIAGAFLSARWIKSLLYQTDALDPAVVLGAITLLLAVAITAALLPGRRSASVDPMKALRTE